MYILKILKLLLDLFILFCIEILVIPVPLVLLEMGFLHKQ